MNQTPTDKPVPPCSICGEPIDSKIITFWAGVRHMSVKECMKAIQQALHPHRHWEPWDERHDQR